jgi:hypothetical protein
VRVGCLDGSMIAALADARLPAGEVGRGQDHARACLACHESVLSAPPRSGIAPAANADGLESALVLAAEAPPLLAAGQQVGR